jgi:hypothetical protein
MGAPMMTGKRRCLAAVLMLASCAGCAHWGKKSTVAMSEPGLGDPAEGEVVVAGTKHGGWVDRHPLFSKPRDVYQNTNHHPVTKVAAATVVGVPVGVACELGQIVKGAPPTH